MNDSTDPYIAIGPSTVHPARSAPSKFYPNIFLPKRIYEALPATYLSFGSIFILGAAYIGFDHGPTLGYLAVGISCIFAGATVTNMRRSDRST